MVNATKVSSPSKTSATKGAERKWHPAACIFPMLSDVDLYSLAEDIHTNGQREPIVMFEGMVLDGRNRWMACKLAGVEPIVKEFKGSRAEALAFVWSLNFHRRHLSSSQAAIADAERAKLDGEYAKQLDDVRKKAPKNQHDKKKSAGTNNCTSKDTTALTDHKRAASTGTNRTYIKAADEIVEKRPDLAKKIKAGTLTIPQAKVEIKREAKRKEISEATARAEKHESDRPKWSILNVDVMVGLKSVCDEWGPARLVFTDPPYNIGIDYGNGSKKDSRSDFEYMGWVSEWLALCEDCLTDDGSLWVMINDEYAVEWLNSK